MDETFSASRWQVLGGQPAELAPLYVLLASAEPTYSTGQVFGAVGGRGGP
jgi:hypothetical protein